MGRCVSSAATISVALLVMCSGLSCSSSKVRPEPVSFDHPDEVIRGEGGMVLADRREFAVMAFLNATGFDEETQDQQMHPVRVKVREMVVANLAEHPQKVKAWRRYRSGLVRRYLGTYNYQDYVLSLSADYPFRRIRTDDELGYWYTAGLLRNLPKVLNDFWATAGLDEVWNQVKGDYIAELKRYDFARRQREMTSLWAYLRMERRDSFTIVNVPDLLDCHFTAIGAVYENYHYSVEGPGATGYGLNTHEYLHSIVNPLVRENYAKHKRKLLKYYRAGKHGPACKSYQNPVVFTWECLVHAVDHRLAVRDNPKRENWANQRVASLSQKGLVLTQPFYDLLADYELSDKSFDQYLPILLERLPEFSVATPTGRTTETDL
jgi:hypothetical protein